MPVVGSPVMLAQPIRSAGTSVKKTLYLFSHIFLPVAASTQTTFSPSLSVPGSARTIVYNLPFITMGV